MTDDKFYSAFTDRHRGPRELVSSRLEADYLSFVQLLGQGAPSGSALDLGCGRGEWLEILAACRLAPHGIDLDEGMVAGCRERGLSVARQDALSACKELSDASQVLVSAFHLVEHLPLETLQVLMQEILRVLQPGGLMILETPNPENILVSTSGFFLDPTHQRPIPLHLLVFFAEYAGFAQIKVLRLHEPPELAGKSDLTLFDVLDGVSPDYAIVAQKAGSTEQMAMIAEAFAADAGLALETLAARYDQQTRARLEQAESRACQAEAELSSLRASRSWRLTRPLRATIDLLRRLRVRTDKLAAMIRQYRNVATTGLVSVRVRFAAVQPGLRDIARVVLYRFPRLKAFLLTLFWKMAELREEAPPTSEGQPESGSLTTRGRRIQAELLAAIKACRKEKD